MRAIGEDSIRGVSSNAKARVTFHKVAPSSGSRVHAKANEGDAMLKEFREFALKGNVVDLAIGVMNLVEAP